MKRFFAILDYFVPTVIFLIVYNLSKVAEIDAISTYDKSLEVITLVMLIILGAAIPVAAYTKKYIDAKLDNAMRYRLALAQAALSAVLAAAFFVESSIQFTVLLAVTAALSVYVTHTLQKHTVSYPTK